MGKYLFVHLNGLLVDISSAYERIVKLEWMSLRQSNSRFDISFEDFEKLEKRIRPLIVGDGNGFWIKFWKHVLIELGVHPVPSVIDGLLEKFRTFFVNSSELYPDVKEFLNLARSNDFKVVLVESGSKELVDRTLNKFGLKDFFHRVILVPDFSRNRKEFFDFALDDLQTGKDNVLVLCSRADKDFALLSELGFGCVLVTRKFYERANRKLPEVFARNLLQVFDSISSPEIVEKPLTNDFYSSVIDELNS